MQARGYRIIPVNPQIAEALGEKSYASLLDLPRELAKQIDLVDVFRRSEFVDEIVEHAIHLKIPAIWLQEDVIDERAAEKRVKPESSWSWTVASSKIIAQGSPNRPAQAKSLSGGF